ncbi:MAG: DNA-binding transcriptional LysR family regulator [Myxococcota bacterium]|jgi:DNA-binding transcriptional LysR family regulator
MSLDWDELRLCRTVFEERGLRKSAVKLGMSHATLRRRLESLEASLGVVLFDRRPSGLHPTPAAMELLPLIERMSDNVATLRRKAAGLVPGLEGWVHVSLPDMLASELLAEPIAAFCREWPSVQVRVQTTNDFADLTHREADLAVRVLPLGVKPDEDLIGYRGGPLVAAVYGETDDWIGFDGIDAVVANTPMKDGGRLGAFNSVYLQRALCRAGSGLAMLPCFMGGDLPRRTPPTHAADVWVLVHPDQRRNPRVRLFREQMVAALETEAARLEA